jgi:hypothetical protein
MDLEDYMIYNDDEDEAERYRATHLTTSQRRSGSGCIFAGVVGIIIVVALCICI